MQWVRSATVGFWAFALCLGAATGVLAAQPTRTAAEAEPIFSDTLVRGGFVLVEAGKAPTIVVDPADAAVVRHAADDLADDIKTVTGQAVVVGAAPAGKTAILVGALGHSKLIDQLVAARKVDVSRLSGAWESFVIASVDRPLPGVDKALVVIGSDRRGAAFGIYEVAQAMGVSPWAWWADVTPRHRDKLIVRAGVRRFGPPSVRYRGVFVNDEDWGLYPWAAKTFDPERGDIGPKTYRRIFTLLLRLKANTLWPAMHHTTAPFNSDPANAKLAEEYGIVMGSSHAEAMLRNNVGEWKDAPDKFNYATNPDGVKAYWEERAKTNGAYESLWTVGMRGIHDSGMVGPKTLQEKVDLLDKIIADQRAILAKDVSADVTKVPQIFVPYKEVLEIYRAGVKVPDDVTIVWPDDNFGYIRQFASAEEANRKGGAGVYYHLSYLGYPLSYLWLGTTPPALVQEEMIHAWDKGARNVWVANVGDIKPAEIGASHFLEMAWDIDRWRGKSQRQFLEDWSRRAFGPTLAGKTAELMDSYYRLNFERRPEHMEWQPKAESRHLSSYTPDEVNDRLRAFRKLVDATKAASAQVPPDLADAWFELVEFPIRVSAAANVRFFAAERYNELIDDDQVMARSAGAAAVDAQTEITTLTDRFNTKIAGGKWRWLMPEEPADSQWRIYRARPVPLPGGGLISDPGKFLAVVDGNAPANSPVIEAEAFAANTGWRLVEGVGRGRGVMIADAPGATLTLNLEVASAGRSIQVGVLPIFPDGQGQEIALDVSVDGAAPQRVSWPRNVGSPAWAQGVLDNLLKATTGPVLSPGRHTVTIVARAGRVGLDQLRLVTPEVIPTHENH
ncbi:glycosyl hydrolase 115 family protein [Caulobacter sp. 1776]|uniref:glycosyl hydrolase 115 family protein n=1 Tax=Caulobacter sp. 1776 TaxID=3156420 RepID=UPI003392F377